MQRYPCQGFALTELLIAVVLLALGLLGNVALLVAGLQAERNAANLATAATLTADLGERIRANQDADWPMGSSGCGSAARSDLRAGCAIRCRCARSLRPCGVAA
jgi:type IV pilus modification protein PilV